MDRPFPLARGLPNNPAQGIRRTPRPPRLLPAVRDALPSLTEVPASTAVVAQAAATSTLTLTATSSSSSSTTAAPTTTVAAAPAIGPPISPGQVVKLAREAMEKAVTDDKNRASESEASAIQGDTLTLRPGITIDLSRNNIPLLPDEVIDIIKDKLER